MRCEGLRLALARHVFENGVDGRFYSLWEDPGQPSTINGEALSVLAAQRAHIPDGWLKNRHPAGAA